MRSIIIALLVFTAAVSPAHADWDPVLEAKEAAQRQAAEQRAREQQAEMNRMRAGAMAEANTRMMEQKRKHLGAAANGKSDAEVSRMYDERIAKDTQEAYAASEKAQRTMADPGNSARMKAMTGKSMEELTSMSDAELEAFAAEMEGKAAAMGMQE